MLKRSEPLSPPHPERPIGELVHELVEEGKAYARAELGVAKAVASAKGKALGLPAALLGAALLIAQAAVTVLAVAVFGSLQWLLGTLLAGLVAFLIFAAIAGGLAWFAIQRVRRDW